jgi:uncharacterized protein
LTLKGFETMKKYLLALFITLWSINLKAQAPVEKTLLWEISGNGLTEPSFLFGTIHLICPDDFVIGNPLKKAVETTRQIAFEVDMDDPELMTAMTKSMFMAGGNTLQTILNAKDYRRLHQFFKDSLGMDITSLDRAKPFVMTGPLLTKVLACQPKSYEMELMTLATKQQSEVIGLETIEEQMALFDTIPYARQASLLVSMIDSLPSVKKEFRDLVKLYKSQDLPAIYALTLKSEFGLDGQDEVLLFKRNRNWIERIRKIIREKPTLIAVGAAHLGGKEGVVALLRESGYQVKAVTQ